jgi:hypothetical protein
MPELKGANDFYFLNAAEPTKIVEEIIRLVTVRLPRYLQCDPLAEIQILSPMRKTITGVENLNTLLQKVLNAESSSKPELYFGERIFRQGDKVMQIRNNYQKMIFNGDMGRIVKIDPEEQLVTVAFTEEQEEHLVTYDYEELDELVLAYAISVHKSQGSEYPVVVLPVTTQHLREQRRWSSWSVQRKLWPSRCRIIKLKNVIRVWMSCWSFTSATPSAREGAEHQSRVNRQASKYFLGYSSRAVITWCSEPRNGKGEDVIAVFSLLPDPVV